MNVGLEAFGALSILMISASAARMLDMSGAANLNRLVSALKNNKESQVKSFGAAELISTAIMNTAVIHAISSAIALPLVRDLFNLDTDGNTLIVSSWLFIAINLSTTLAAVSSGLLSTLDAAHRSDLRSMIVIGSALLTLASAAWLVPSLGIIGLVISQAASNAFVVLASAVTTRVYVPSLSIVWPRWSLAATKWSASYALRYNVVNLTAMFFDPVVKYVLNGTGGTASVATYDLATRLVVQTRGIVVAAFAPVIPIVAEAQNLESGYASTLVVRLTRVMWLVSVAFFFSNLAAVPVLSIFFLSEIDRVFVLYAISVIAGWSSTIVSLPVYFAGQAVGDLKWNIVSQFVLSSVIVVSALSQLVADDVHFVVLVGFALFASSTIQILGNTFALRLPKARNLASISIVILLLLLAMGVGMLALVDGML
jgi:hypothetical protein